MWMIGRLVVIVSLALGWSASAAATEAIATDRLLEDAAQAFRRGAFEDAATGWDRAARAFQEAGARAPQADALLHLAEAHQALGQHRKALDDLATAQEAARQAGDRVVLARILWGAGHLYTAVGQWGDAEPYLAEALRLSKEMGDANLSAGILNDLGNLHGARGRYADAKDAYRQSVEWAEAAHNPAIVTRAILNTAKVETQAGRYREAKAQFDHAVHLVRTLDESHDKAYELITVGLGYDRLRRHLPAEHRMLTLDAFQALHESAVVAERLDDARAASYGWGYMGGLYEEERRYEEALELTHRAIAAAQRAVAPESLYRWHWQDGRLLALLGRPDDAIAAYRRAIYALQAVRPEIAVSLVETGASFRDTIGAPYYELAELLVRRAEGVTDRVEAEGYLREARDAVELFKLAELRDYFRDDCVDAGRSRITEVERVSRDAAVIYPLVFKDRLVLLASFSTGMVKRAVPVSEAALTQEVRALRRLLEKRTTNQYLPHAKRLYDWLIRPLEGDLREAGVSTLVFVPDGALRTIPMAALHDGERFLIATYAIATTPGLTLTDPRPMKRDAVKVLSGGLTQAVQGFPALPNVSQELQALRQLFGATLLLDREFRVERFEQELKAQPFSVVHIASHGQFSGDVQNSFLLAFDDRLTLDRLDEFVGVFRFRNEPLALLTLSACETAAGDDRAALGLAGVAIKAGARSALATLWYIDDRASSELVTEFYRQLHDDPAVSKAEALRRAQLKLLADRVFDHPAYWAPFLLLNNWL